MQTFKPALQFVVMVTPEDMKANAEYFKMADHVCRSPAKTHTIQINSCLRSMSQALKLLVTLCSGYLAEQITTTMQMWSSYSILQRGE